MNYIIYTELFTLYFTIIVIDDQDSKDVQNIIIKSL